MQGSIAHTRWDCTYHTVWMPKYRKKVLYGEVLDELRQIIKKLLEYKKIKIVEGCMCVDHVYLSVRIPPKESVSKVMGYLKSVLILFGDTTNGERGSDETGRFGLEGILLVRSVLILQH